MATLAALRGYLNDEIGVVSDSETSPFSLSLRNRAISSGYAALWRAGVWKPVQVDLATVADQVFYTVTGMRRLGQAYTLDSTGAPIGTIPALLEQRAASYVLTVPALDSGGTIRLEGWTAYVSTFASDAANDDLEDEYNRIPLLKAKAICLRKALADFARYGTRQTTPPEMTVTVDGMLGLVAAAEREFEAECRALSGQRPHYSQPIRNKVLG